jgi:hypothetical protein
LALGQGPTSPAQYSQAQYSAQQHHGSPSRPRYTIVGPVSTEVLRPCQPHQEPASGTSRWYVAPYVCGQLEFAGCLPQLDGSDDVDGLGSFISMQPYVDALAAADAARATATAAMALSGV